MEKIEGTVYKTNVEDKTNVITICREKFVIPLTGITMIAGIKGIAFKEYVYPNIRFYHHPEYDGNPDDQWAWQRVIVKKFNKDKDKKIVIISDSPFILDGFLISISLKDIKNTDFSIVYFVDDKMQTFIPTEAGRIKHTPEGFFDTMDRQMKILVGF